MRLNSNFGHLSTTKFQNLATFWEQWETILTIMKVILIFVVTSYSAITQLFASV